ncbi:DUF6089 family protein [Pontibacter sp. MBLB2868]|uniref:DUF6089 family protein n=1 Tax=Pontibacter sp. MBLB2868 TaxID=3451555 RepID=UPI003F74C39B
MRKNLLSKKHLLLTLFSLFLIHSAYSQSSNLEVGAHLSAFVYQGDLTPNPMGSIETIGPGIGVFGKVRLYGPLALKLNIEHGRLSGDDANYANPAWRRERNFSFHTPITEFSGQFVFDLVKFGKYTRYLNITPYVAGGVGVSYLRIKRDYSQSQLDRTAGLEEDIAKALPSHISVLMAGGGVRYGLTRSIALNAEISYRFASSSDYLDGFSKSGNPNMNDHYYTTSVGVVYSFPYITWGKKSFCPAYK